jgi:hypothetical protein
LFICNFIFFLFYSSNTVKAGGMRIVQHKTPGKTEHGKSEPIDVIGYSQNNPIDTNVQLASSPNHKTIVVESSQTSHAYKAPASVPGDHYKPVNHIQQPRK